MGQSKIDRTNNFETAVKVGIIEDQVAKEIQEVLFDRLIREGKIVIDDRRTATISDGFSDGF